MALTFEKIEQQAPALVNLSKKASFSLSKAGLDDVKARVALIADYSGSMYYEYEQGKVQSLAERVLALATQLDDDGEVEFFVFDSSADYLGEIDLGSYQGSVDKMVRGRNWGSTNYAAGINTVVDHYFGGARTGRFGKFFGGGKSSGDTTVPVFTLFLTDGVPDSEGAAERALQNASQYPIFWKFLSVGSEHINFLQRLDDLDGRKVDNADYKPVGDLNSLKDAQLLDMILEEFNTWLTAAKSANILTN